MKKEFTGELLGTFLLVFFGCGAIAGAVCFDAFSGLFQIAAIWGIAVALAITLTGSLSGAHLNPAITIAFVSVDGFSKKKIPHYFAGQFMGAFLAAALLYGLFGPSITALEAAQGLTRGSAGSEASAKIFGEFHSSNIPLWNAFLAEFLGTLLLAFFVFGLIFKHRSSPFPNWFIPVGIGLALTILISIFAPISMAGFNPARDFAPRLFSTLAGWGLYPFQANGSSWFLVYIVAPFLGAPLGARIAGKVFSAPT